MQKAQNKHWRKQIMGMIHVSAPKEWKYTTMGLGKICFFSACGHRVLKSVKHKVLILESRVWAKPTTQTMNVAYLIGLRDSGWMGGQMDERMMDEGHVRE